MSEDAGSLPEGEVETLMTSDHTAFQGCSSWKCRVGIGRFSGKALTREGCGSLFMQPVGCTPWCCTDDVQLQLFLVRPCYVQCSRRSIMVHQARRAGKKLSIIPNNITPNSCLPVKMKYPANSSRSFSWLTRSTPNIIFEERSNI